MPFVTPRRAASMSALGQKQTLQQVCDMSALPPNADIDRWHREVCLVDCSSCERNPKTRHCAKIPGLEAEIRICHAYPVVRDHNEISIRYVLAFLFWPARHFHLPNLPVCAAARACSATFAPKRQCRNAAILHATRVGCHAWHRQTAMIAFFNRSIA